MTGTGYSVMIAKPELPDPRKLADVLEGFHKLSGDEAVEMARRSWGFAGEDLTRDRAIVLAGKCRETGIEAITVDSRDITSLPVEKDLIKAGTTPTGLNYTLRTGETGFVPWERTVLIAAAAVKEKKIISQVSVKDPAEAEKAYFAAIAATAGIPCPNEKNGEAKTELPEYELFFYLELFFSVFPHRLRMRSDMFDYSCLGNRNEYSSRLNFRIFLDDVAAVAFKSLKNRGAKAIIGGQPLHQLGYDSLSRLEKESRWLLTIRNIGN